MAKDYEVTHTEQRERLGPGGQPETVYEVYLTTDRGVSGSVVVKQADWNAEALGAILATRAAELDLALTL